MLSLEASTSGSQIGEKWRFSPLKFLVAHNVKLHEIKYFRDKK